MAIDASDLTDYSWSDIAKAAKHAMVQAAVGGATLVINGRTIGRISIKEAKLLYETAQEQIAAAESDGGIGLGVYGERA